MAVVTGLHRGSELGAEVEAYEVSARVRVSTGHGARSVRSPTTAAVEQDNRSNMQIGAGTALRKSVTTEEEQSSN